MAEAEPKNEPMNNEPNNETPPADPPAKKQSVTLRPMLYNFRVAPVKGNIKQFATQMPFAILLDNLIAVLWSMYNKETQLRCGINQIQWALEFMKCLKVDYNYPESIGNIVKILEKNMIELYSKISEIQQKEKMQEPSVEILDSKTDLKSDPKAKDEHALYFNESDIQKKLAKVKLRVDKVTGKPRYIKELNELGKRKPKVEECKDDDKSPQTFVIGALKKILNKSTEANTRTDVEELIKELNKQKKTQSATGDKTDKTDKTGKTDKADKTDKSDKTDKADKTDKTDKTDETDKTDKTPPTAE